MSESLFEKLAGGRPNSENKQVKSVFNMNNEGVKKVNESDILGKHYIPGVTKTKEQVDRAQGYRDKAERIKAEAKSNPMEWDATGKNRPKSGTGGVGPTIENASKQKVVKEVGPMSNAPKPKEAPNIDPKNGPLKTKETAARVENIKNAIKKKWGQATEYMSKNDRVKKSLIGAGGLLAGGVLGLAKNKNLKRAINSYKTKSVMNKVSPMLPDLKEGLLGVADSISGKANATKKMKTMAGIGAAGAGIGAGAYGISKAVDNNNKKTANEEDYMSNNVEYILEKLAGSPGNRAKRDTLNSFNNKANHKSNVFTQSKQKAPVSNNAEGLGKRTHSNITSNSFGGTSLEGAGFKGKYGVKNYVGRGGESKAKNLGWDRPAGPSGNGHGPTIARANMDDKLKAMNFEKNIAKHGPTRALADDLKAQKLRKVMKGIGTAASMGAGLVIGAKMKAVRRRALARRISKIKAIRAARKAKAASRKGFFRNIFKKANEYDVNYLESRFQEAELIKQAAEEVYAEALYNQSEECLVKSASEYIDEVAYNLAEAKAHAEEVYYSTSNGFEKQAAEEEFSNADYLLNEESLIALADEYAGEVVNEQELIKQAAEEAYAEAVELQEELVEMYNSL